MKAPKFPSFFKTTKNKQFELPVRYYDERKERIQTAVDKANNQQDGNLERGHFANSWKKSQLKEVNPLYYALLLLQFFFVSLHIGF